jgi:hypothetical protein
MAAEHDKGLIEIAKFREFVNEADLLIYPQSIAKREPPEPDILCLHEEEGYIAFELMEICDPNLARQISESSKKGGVPFLWTEDPTLRLFDENIQKKLANKYETSYPVEMLLYTNGSVVTPDDMIIQTIKLKMNGKFKGQFRRIWFHGRDGAHLVCD